MCGRQGEEEKVSGRLEAVRLRKKVYLRNESELVFSSIELEPTWLTSNWQPEQAATFLGKPNRGLFMSQKQPKKNKSPGHVHKLL